MTEEDTLRELHKALDVLEAAATHFQAEAEMNAALHMSLNIRPAPLAAAVIAQAEDIRRYLAS